LQHFPYDCSEFAKARFPRKGLTNDYPRSPRGLLAG
jgi:hypothetical protein